MVRWETHPTKQKPKYDKILQIKSKHKSSS